MALRGRPPNGSTDKRLKLMLFSEYGVGKTIAAIAMPRPYIIDTENGTNHYDDRVKAAGGVVFHTDDLDEVIAEVRGLMTERHDYRTLVIDSFTPLYDALLDRGEEAVGTEFGRHYGWAAKPCKRLFALLARLDMNVVVTCHSKAEYETSKVGHKTEMSKVGNKADGWKKLEYIFDLVLELQRPRNGVNRVAIVRKTRLAAFPDLDTFQWSFDALAQRSGRANLEAQAEPVKLALKSQVKRLERLVKAANVPQATVDKWLERAKVDSLADMPRDAIGACIDHLAKKLKQATGETNGVEVEAEEVTA